MAYPERLLSADEEIITQFRPHWSGILKEGALVVGAAVVAVLLAFLDVNGWVVSAVVLLAVAIAAEGLIRWLTTLHVVTNERVIYRAGFIGKRGKEIPLEVINDVAFNQRIIERLFGTGDLMIESAGTHGQTRYSDIPAPEKVQTAIYKAREERMLHMESGGRDAAQSESMASQLERLSRLNDEGKLTDDEFEREKQKLLGDD
jgi:uncharacterized membrane protein YdbT with pleckstrin-like domain